MLFRFGCYRRPKIADAVSEALGPYAHYLEAEPLSQYRGKARIGMFAF